MAGAVSHTVASITPATRTIAATAAEVVEHQAAPVVRDAGTAVEQAREGFDHLFDFPSLKPGDTFKIADGSHIGGVGNIGGKARLDGLTPTDAKVWVEAKKFLIKRRATLEITQTGPTTAKLVGAQEGKDPQSKDLTVVAVETNKSVMRPTDGSADNVTMTVDPKSGIVTLDEPTSGSRLVLEPDDNRVTGWKRR